MTLPGEKNSQPPIAEGDIVAGKYQVEKILGTGGMGIVVAARHIELEERVAIKFLLPTVAEREDAALRFRREARAAAKIKGEHVCRVYDVGETDQGVSYMIMEYLEGHDLGEELQKFGVMPTEVAVGYALEAIEAVAQAHAGGIVHRDLKPANLYLSRRPDGSSVIKVLDFGISKSLIARSIDDISLTASASIMGSPLYMSPEQLQSARDVDARTDIWALGSILYEMLAGRPPYLAETFPQLCAMLLNDRPPPLCSIRPDLPAGLGAAVDRCLEKDRTRRWATVSEFASAISEFASARSRVHAERASRVMRSTDATISNSGEMAPPTERMVSSVGAHRPTVSSWADSQGGKPKKPKALLWVGAAGAAFALLALYLLLRGPAGVEAPRLDQGASAAAQIKPSTELVPSPAVTETVSAKPAPTPTVEPAPSVVANVPSSAPVPASKGPNRAVKGPAVIKHPAGPSSQPGPSSGSSISDFGGRR